MSEPIYAFPLGDDYRVAVYADPDAEWYPPYENWEHIGIHTLTMSEDNTPIYHTPVGAESVSEWLVNHYADVDVHTGAHSDHLEQSMFDYFKSLGTQACLLAMNGHLSSQWGIVLLYDTVRDMVDVSRNKLDNHASELTDWWRGDVYMAQIQKRIVYLAENGKTLIRWERADDVQPNTAGGLYLSGDATLNNVLRGIGWIDTEHFWENN